MKFVAKWFKDSQLEHVAQIYNISDLNEVLSNISKRKILTEDTVKLHISVRLTREDSQKMLDFIKKLTKTKVSKIKIYTPEENFDRLYKLRQFSKEYLGAEITNVYT